MCNYGGNGITIATNLNIPIEDGERIYEGYFKAFPLLKTYFEKKKKEGLKNGYILISTLTGRKTFGEAFEKYKQVENEVSDIGFWGKFRIHKEDGFSTEEGRRIKGIKEQYFLYKGKIERWSLNYPEMYGAFSSNAIRKFRELLGHLTT